MFPLRQFNKSGFFLHLLKSDFKISRKASITIITVNSMRKHPKIRRKYPLSLLRALKPMVTITGDKKRNGREIAKNLNPFFRVFLADEFSITSCLVGVFPCSFMGCLSFVGLDKYRGEF